MTEAKLIFCIICGHPADRIWKLRRDYQQSELAIHLGVLYDLLEAATPDGLIDLKAGKTVSLSKQCRGRRQKSDRLQCYQHFLRLQELFGR